MTSDGRPGITKRVLGDGTPEVEVWLTPHDTDHLKHGAPVYKPLPGGELLTLRAVETWDEWRSVVAAQEADR